jgi:hypothetical protein
MQATKGVKRKPCYGRDADEMSVNLKKVMIELGITDVEKVLRIDMDDNPDQALEFMKEVLAKRVRQSLQPH